MAALVGTLPGEAAAEVIAGTQFSEPPVGSHSWAPSGAEVELGFSTVFQETQGAGSIATLGVDDNPLEPTRFVLRTVEATTTFDAVSLDGYQHVLVDIRVWIAEAGWESTDFFRAELHDGGAGLVPLFDLDEAALDAAAKDTPLHFQAEIPPGWTHAILEVSGHTNSSSDAEHLAYDAITFDGIAVGATVLPRGATWRYRDDGVDPGSGWSSPAYDDSGWASGAAELGYGDGDEATVIDAGPEPAPYTTSWFRADVAAAAGASPALELRLLRDDGARAFLSGSEIARSNLPEGTVDAATPAVENLTGGEERRWHVRAMNAAALAPGSDVLAVEVHQALPTSSDVSFDAALAFAPLPAPPGLDLIRAPYVQQVTDSHAIVRWRTDRPTPSVVRWGPAIGNLSEQASTPGWTTEHEVEIGPLPAGSSSYYAVGTGSVILAGDDAEHVVTTAPTPGSRPPIRIWVVGDSGRCGVSLAGCVDAGAVRDAYLSFAGLERADLWLMLGDNAYTDGTDAEYTAGVFRLFAPQLRDAPVWATPGNHEFPVSDSATESGPYYDAFTLPTQGEAGGVASQTEAYYSFDWGNVHFVSLDSTDTPRAPGDPMLTWLAADLAATQQDWVIAFWHHPPYTKGSHDSDTESDLVEIREDVVPILEAHGVDLVLTGHSHSYERSMLIDGHHGSSASFDPALHARDAGDGDPAGDGEYEKPTLGTAPNEGAVFAVVGSSSKDSGPLTTHPVMVRGVNYEGSLVLDVDGAVLEAAWIDMDGDVQDRFRIRKGGPACGNGIDDDGDGKIDASGGPNGERADYGCTSALDRSEVDPGPRFCGLGPELPLVLAGLGGFVRRRRGVRGARTSRA